mmetsp:Transcript_21131/g.42608  ORF Transcript_21131/g.42608 Transcript_21131/m.42608 type:complete len:253 (+) Transcript_21131:639-1397(+)
MDLFQDLNRIDKIINTDDTRHHIKRVVVVGKFRFDIQVLRLVVLQLVIVHKFKGVHPRRRDPAHGLWKLQRVVRHPAGANVQDVAPRFDVVPVVLRQGRHGRLVDVVHEPGHRVERLVVVLVRPEEVLLTERLLLRPLLHEPHGTHGERVRRRIPREAPYQNAPGAGIAVRAVRVFHLEFVVEIAGIFLRVGRRPSRGAGRIVSGEPLGGGALLDVGAEGDGGAGGEDRGGRGEEAAAGGGASHGGGSAVGG